MIIPGISSVIKLDNIAFDLKLLAFENAGKSIEPSTGSVSDPTQCRGLVLSEWVERFREIGDLLDIYQQLVEKDAESIRQSQKALNDADKERAKDIINDVMDSVNTVIRKTSGGGSSGRGSGGGGGRSF